MFPMENAPYEKVNIIKSKNQTITGVDVVFKSNEIWLEDTSIAPKENDVVERPLPNGVIERYLIVQSTYYNAIGSFPDHYQLKIEKENTPIKQTSEKTTIYNISDVNKVNIHSTDNSINTFFVNKDKQIFDELKKLSMQIENNERIISAIEKMENSTTKKNFLTRYNDFIQLIAGHITVYAPLLPCLMALLDKYC